MAGSWGRGRRYRDMQQAIGGVSPLTGRDVAKVLAWMVTVAVITILLRALTPLNAGLSGILAAVAVTASAVLWARRR